MKHLGISFGQLKTWHDGLGEVSQRLGMFIASEADKLRESGIDLHYHLPQKWHGHFGDNVNYLATNRLQRIIHLHHERFDLWHTLHQHNRFLPPLGSKQRLLTVHDLNFLYSNSPTRIHRHIRRTQRIINRQTALVCISKHVGKDMVDSLRLKTLPELIYNGVADLTTELSQAPVDRPAPGFLLHISRMAASKNIACLINLAAEMPNGRFVFAGPHSPDSVAVRREVEIRGLTNIQLLENVTEAEKTWLYKNCRGFLFPSLTEGFGLPPIEAMHFGKPVFLSRLTSLPEIGGEVAFYFDSFDTQAMMTTVNRGLAAAADDAGMAPAITAHARGFNWLRCGSAYLELYKRLILSNDTCHP